MVKEKMVELADRLDREGKYELADAVDGLFSTAAGRPRAPLKKMDDKVKKNLLKFLHDAETNMGDSIDGLEELFRRLRYFDLSGNIKEMGLDKMLKDIGKVETSLSEAKKKFYELTHGKKPLKDEMNAMFSDDGEDQSADDPIEFFKGQNAFDFDDTDFSVKEEDGGEVEPTDEELEAIEDEPEEDDLDIEELMRFLEDENELGEEYGFGV